jgi:Spy/CpxP family protein refolding chaperone
MRLRNICTLTGLAATVWLSAVVQAQPASPQLEPRDCPMLYLKGDIAAGAGDEHRFHEGSAKFSQRMPRFLEQLELRPEQHEGIREVFERYQARLMVLRLGGQNLRERVQALSPDDAQYAQVTAETADAAAVLARDTVMLLSEMRVGFYALLDADQRHRLEERGDADRQRWEDWRKRHQAVPPAQ